MTELTPDGWPSTSPTDVPAIIAENGDAPSSFQWDAANICLSLTLFVAAGLAEIGGGWLVWQAVRGPTSETPEGAAPNPTTPTSSSSSRQPWWWAVFGSALLVLYGFLPTWQPSNDSFGRIYAVYGGFFIALSFLWGWLLDGNRPDLGDGVGGAVALVGVCLILFWPRS